MNREEQSKRDKENCSLCGVESSSRSFIPLCNYTSRVQSTPDLCMFKPEYQNQCRFFEGKEESSEK